jgi:phage shock protein PspC (stress-responsive transcriptional regulator)
MKKTLNINLGGFIFHIDEDAFNQLERYLSVLKEQFSRTQGGDEIVKDVEIRLAELFKEKTTTKEVVTLTDVEEAIGVLGQPEDYLDPDAAEETREQGTADYATQSGTTRKIFRDADNRILGGVASGLAAYFNIDALWMRLIFIAFLFAGFGLLLYLILWLVVPKAKTTADKLQMRGEPVTLSNIERAIKEEAAQVGESFKSFSQRARAVNRSGPSKVTQFLREVIQLFIDFVKLLLKAIFKILGFALLALGFVVLFGLLLALISGSVEVNGMGYSLSDLLAALKNIAPTTAHYHAFLLGLGLLTLPPLAMLVYLGLRLLFQINPLPNPVRHGLAILVLTGLGLTIFASVRTGMEFNRFSAHTVTQPLPNQNGPLQVAMLQDSIHEDFASGNFKKPWQHYTSGDALKMVDLRIKRSNAVYSYLETEVLARGPSRESANRNARQAVYPARLDTGKVILPLYYFLPQGEKFRGQKINLRLFLAEGDTLFFQKGLEELLTDMPNKNNYWAYEMANHHWTMTEGGLLCADCPEPMEDRLPKDTLSAQTGEIAQPKDSLKKIPHAAQALPLVQTPG